MSFKVINFSTIRLCVQSVSKSSEWYKIFFNKLPIEEIENFVSFKIGDTFFDICLADDKNPISKGGTVGYWVVDNLDAAITHSIKLGAKVYRGPMRVKEIQKTIAQIEDPFGNIFGLESEA